MARPADDETQLRDFHAQRFSQRTMARLLSLSPSTVAKRLKQLGLSAPTEPLCLCRVPGPLFLA